MCGACRAVRCEATGRVPSAKTWRSSGYFRHPVVGRYFYSLGVDYDELAYVEGGEILDEKDPLPPPPMTPTLGRSSRSWPRSPRRGPWRSRVGSIPRG